MHFITQIIKEYNHSIKRDGVPPRLMPALGGRAFLPLPPQDHALVSSSLWSPHQSPCHTTGNPFMVGACRRHLPTLPRASRSVVVASFLSCGLSSRFSTNHIQVPHFIPWLRCFQLSISVLLMS